MCDNATTILQLWPYHMLAFRDWQLNRANWFIGHNTDHLIIQKWHVYDQVNARRVWHMNSPRNVIHSLNIRHKLVQTQGPGPY